MMLSYGNGNLLYEESASSPLLSKWLCRDSLAHTAVLGKLRQVCKP